MQPRVLLAIPLLLGALLTGCIGSGDEAGSAVQEQDTGDNGVLDENESAVAPDGRGEISAFRETNRTETGTGGMMHAHDYWGGETRRVIWQQDIGLIPFPLIPEGKSAGTAIADFDIPKPHLVFEGTSQLELLIDDVIVTSTGEQPVDDAMPAHPHITIMFDYLTAADEPGAFRTGGTVVPGTPFIIPVAPTEADMPHQTKSLWIFRIYTGEANAFEFNLTLTAVKGNSVVNWPPHPDLYAESTTRTIFDGDVTLSNKGTVDYLIFANLPAWHHPDRVISYGTEKLEVTISGVQFTSQVQPERFILEVHNASYLPKLGNSDQAGGRYEDPASDGSTYTFVVPVDEEGMDTPYGQASRWGFHFVPRFADATNCFEGMKEVSEGVYHFWQQFVVGCQYFPYEMTYHMKIVAYGHSTAAGTEDLAERSLEGGPAP